MYPHLRHLQERLPNLLQGLTLDLGCGKGKLVLAIAEAGGRVIGLEYNQEYINEAQQRLQTAGLAAEIILGKAEAMPFADNYFDTINMSELIEHVQRPEAVLSEVYRVLKPGGQAYISVPNRFGAFDPHFHLWGINWLPRSWSNPILTFLGKHKDYSPAAGHQRLTEMHYYRFSEIRKLLHDKGFTISDIREMRIRQRIKNKSFLWLILAIYRLARQLYFNTFHFLISKPAV